MEEEIGKESGEVRRNKKRKPLKIWLMMMKRLKIRRESWRWRWKFLGSSFMWNRLNLQLFFLDDVLFKIVSVLEAVVLVTSLCFFFCCCGCHF